MASTNTTVCVPKQCGVRFSPPALVLVYEEKGAKTKLRQRVMPIRHFRCDSSVAFAAKELKIRHSPQLDSVPIVTIEKMLRLLQEHLKGVELHTALETVNKELMVKSEEDLNKLSDPEIKRQKELMDQTFYKNQVKPHDERFVYDKRVNFEEKGTEKAESGWDTGTEDGDDFWN